MLEKIDLFKMVDLSISFLYVYQRVYNPNSNIAIENGPVEIVDLPIKNRDLPTTNTRIPSCKLT